jgi:hypothetical protein
MTNIIGDIAGQYQALLKLVEQMPEGETISVGDMIDRGLDSKRVIEFFMKENRCAILGNHEHLMLDWCTKSKFYDTNVWFNNGGEYTLLSYSELAEQEQPIPQEHIDWIKQLPKWIELKDININDVNQNVLISHAFLYNAIKDDEEAIEYACDFGVDILDKDETTIIWNREPPIRRKNWDLQICGHNSQFGLRQWSDHLGTFAVSLDDSRRKKLTGLHLETMTIYQQPY